MAKRRKAERADARENPPANSHDLEVEVWDDPEWLPALDAMSGYQADGTYTGKPDLRPLAALLRSGKPVPEAVAMTLGELLDPPWGKKGPRLSLIIAERYSPRKDLEFVKEMLELRRLIEEELRKAVKLESAINAVSKNTKISRSKLMKAWSWDFEKSVIKTSTYNPDGILSPREPGKS